MRTLIITAILATGLAGCQTLEQSQANADVVCQQSGFRPTTRSYQNCVAANIRQDRRQSDAATGVVVAGATAGLIGAALVADSRSSRYYDRGYYGRGYGGRGYNRNYYGGRGYRRGCGAWGC
ncbi:hypothetical protein [Bosea sp. AAP35]|uniref:hypothetical protein n=1 Tax=Bosea sp. AAP35 TaxID=1523417 RepID=UPI0006B909D1|nr:hypothetical protein [Bosea sp. AAP35]